MASEQQVFHQKLQNRLGFLGDLSIVRHGFGQFGQVSVCLRKGNQLILANYQQNEICQIMQSEKATKDDFIEQIYWEFSRNLNH